MAKAKLIINNEREVAIDEGVTSIGRVSDNTISLADDSNVSRYHAEIETRGGFGSGDEFWLIELGSSNGTTLNGEKVYDEQLLQDGDVILLGGTSEILFELERDAPKVVTAENASQISNVQTPVALPNAAAAPEAEIAADTAKTSKAPILLIVAGVVCGLALVCIAAAVLISWNWETKCEAKAIITSPESGDIINKKIEIEVEAEKAECAQRAIFLIDGEEIARTDSEPYAASLDPKQFPEFSDGGNHSLKIVLEDAKGNKIVQPGEVLLAFETLATPTPTPEAAETPKEEKTPKPAPNKQTSLIETQEMCKRLLKGFSGNSRYNVSDAQFLQEVQRKTAEYAAAEGFFARAEPFRDLINVEFHKENGLDVSLGYILAMSRSKFNANKQGADEGLWRLSDGFVTANNYKAACPGESLSDPAQNCAAETSSIYLKALVLKIFNGDVIYAVSAFGMSEQEASQWQSTLPAERADFWKVIKSPAQREQIARFFAAGIVAENPQKFGLKKDRPISGLYANLMGN